LRSAESALEDYLARLVPNPAFAALFRRYGLRYRWLAVFTVVTGNIAAVLSGTIINVAIPDIMGAFGIGQDDAQWMSTANLAASTVAMLASAWMVQRTGLRGTVLVAIGLFIAGSLLGGLATHTGVMIVSRMMQGITAGLLTPLSMSIIFQVFPAGRQGVAMGISAVGIILAPAIGPAIGGVLVDSFNWRYVFYLGVPFSLLTLLGALVFLPGRQAHTRVPFDWTGMLLLSASITALLVGLTRGERDGWDSDYILGCFAVCALTGSAFVYTQLTRAQPLLDFTLFANRTFLIMSVNGFVFGAGLYASTYLLPLFLQLVQRLTPTDSGAMMIPAGLAMVLVFPFAGRLADRVDARVLIGTGIGFFVLAFWLMSRADANTGFWRLAWWILISRVGIGLVMPALQMGALRDVEPSRLTQASGSFNFIRQMGGAYGVNLMSVVLERRNSVHADYLASTQTFANGDTLALLQQLRGLAHTIGYSGTDEWTAAMAFLQQMVQQQALALAFRDSFMILALAFLATLLPTLALRARPRRAAAAPPAPAMARVADRHVAPVAGVVDGSGATWIRAGRHGSPRAAAATSRDRARWRASRRPASRRAGTVACPRRCRHAARAGRCRRTAGPRA
jgi:EmrB/QacA subfamily drug resistance transporter